jgi:hypothetical protein
LRDARRNARGEPDAIHKRSIPGFEVGDLPPTIAELELRVLRRNGVVVEHDFVLGSLPDPGHQRGDRDDALLGEARMMPQNCQLVLASGRVLVRHCMLVGFVGVRALSYMSRCSGSNPLAPGGLEPGH